jgi:hypothetical protein
LCSLSKDLNLTFDKINIKIMNEKIKEMGSNKLKMKNIGNVGKYKECF